MKYRKPGLKGPEVSTVGFGAWAISGRDWANTNDKDSKKAIIDFIPSEIFKINYL